ncbi:MAG: hypothetical protein QXG03_01010 [Halalkalicoccus sp.]
MHPLEFAMVVALPVVGVVLTLLARRYGWDDERITRTQWRVFEGSLVVLVLVGSLAVGVLVGGVLGILVAAGFVLYAAAFLVVHYRR